MKWSRIPAASVVEVFGTAVDGPYSFTVAVGASIWGVVGVLIPWGGRLVLLFLLLLLFFFVCVCVLITAVLIIDL